MPARPQHRGSLSKCLANGPLGTLGRTKEQSGPDWRADWPEIQRLRGTPNSLPIQWTPTPQCYVVPRWGGCSWGTCTLPSVSPNVWLSLVTGHPDPGTHLASRALVWSSIVSLPPHPPPNCLQRDPLLGPSLCHHLKTPHATNTCVTRAACRPSCRGTVFASTGPL